MTALLHLAILSAWFVAEPDIARAEKVEPLRFQPVVELFSRMTEIRPKKVHERCVVFALGQAYKANDHVESIIIVTEDPPHLAVSFLVSGGYGMNFVSEFFEAPYFKRHESEEFHRLLYGPQGHSSARFDRYSVDFSRIETPEWHFISMSFGPPKPLKAPAD